MIADEPVRGRTPPPWFRALSGIERERAFSRGLLPWPPLARLLGLRTTHVAAGTVTVAMPASEASVAGTGQLEIAPLMISALEGASNTALPAGEDVVPSRFTFDPFRPVWPRRGNLIARARVVNSGSLFVFAGVQVEDPDGRHIGQGSLLSHVRKIEPPPPPPPETMQPVDEPTYATPDPYLRSVACPPFAELAQREDGVTLIRRFMEGRIPVPAATLYGFRIGDVAEGRVTLSMPASEWLCALGSEISCQAVAAFGDIAVWSVVLSLHRAGTSVVLTDSTTRFLRPARADGRSLRADGAAVELDPSLAVADVRIHDGAGTLVALVSGACVRIAGERRARRPRPQARRVLATILFTDIVDSTGHAKRLGDAAWRALLEQHGLAVRREASRYNGTEVDTTGDGFVIRFDSPVYAIEAARAVRLAVAPLGLDVRCGIHSGECELEGQQLTGIAVHIAARIQAAAEPGAILVSSTVRDLAVGSTVRFVDEGERRLKGIPEPWRLYGVED